MESMNKFIKTVAKLRAPDGCPWDKEQTHKTLKRYLIEETYEAIDAIDKNDSKALMEELGDVLLQVVLHAQIANENKQFSFEDLVNFINNKMISRHPHVFSNVKVNNTEEVLVNWEKLKKEEKPNKEDTFEEIPSSLPALLKGWKISKKASKVGFDWDKELNLWLALEKELKEFKESISLKDKEKQAEELGDLLFMITNIARWYKLNPEESLNDSLKKFIKRFNKVKAKTMNKNLKNIPSKELNKLWELVKKEDKT